MDYVAQSIEKARLQAAEDNFNEYHGGSYPEEEVEEPQEDTCTGLVFVSHSFENVPPNPRAAGASAEAHLENLKKKAAS